MEQHPVPRDITGFKFQLIGFMTIRQFAYLVFGLVIAFIFFRLPISIFRYPLAGLFAFAGVAFAFIPIQERPLEDWVLNMFRALYAPTQYVWRKDNELPAYMIPKTTNVAPVKQRGLAKKQAERSVVQNRDARRKLQQYLNTIQPRQEELLDTKEKGELAQISNLFQDGSGNQRVIIEQTQQENSFVKPQDPVASMANITKKYATPALPQGTVAGLVRADDMALPGMLVHINDESGGQVRLFKTNAAGKFSSAVALPSGSYKATVEDPTRRHEFQDFSFNIDGSGVRPWLIAGKTVQT